MDFVHCNLCFVCPANNQPSIFYFSSCGHLFCANCLKRENNVNQTPAHRTNTCQVCNKVCSYVEINRELKPEIQMFFRSPRDLATQYAQNMKSVLDFQSQHRASLQKHNNEKTVKAMKYVKIAQAEAGKRMEMERAFAAERKKLKSELEKQMEHAKAVESLLAERDLELHQVRQKLATSSKSSRASNLFPNLNGATPINTLSFLNCATSTPINNDMDLFNNRQAARGRSGDRTGVDGGNQFQDIFAMRPGELESPIAGAPFMNTPAMLGISQRNQNTEANVCGNYF